MSDAKHMFIRCSDGSYISSSLITRFSIEQIKEQYCIIAHTANGEKFVVNSSTTSESAKNMLEFNVGNINRLTL